MTDLPEWFDPTRDQLLTPKALRGLVHPIRLRLLDLLQADGPATATGLAKRIGESSGVTSYHLRVLAEHGFVVEDTERGNGRDRWWRAVHRTTSFSFRAGDERASDETIEAAEHFVRLVAEESHRRVLTFVGTLAGRREDELADLPWTVSEWPLMLTLDEARLLRDAVAELVAPYRRDLADVEQRPGTRAYAIFQLVPDLP